MTTLGRMRAFIIGLIYWQLSSASKSDKKQKGKKLVEEFSMRIFKFFGENPLTRRSFTSLMVAFLIFGSINNVERARAGVRSVVRAREATFLERGWWSVILMRVIKRQGKKLPLPKRRGKYNFVVVCGSTVSVRIKFESHVDPILRVVCIRMMNSK